MTRRCSPFAALLLAVIACSPAQADPFKLIITETETPLVPNSVADLALRLGYYKRAGVDVELVRVQQTPSALAALRSRQGDMANVSIDTALQLVARNQMNLKGVFSPDKALPFLIISKKGVAAPKDLEGKVFGVSRVGSVDYLLSRVVLAKLGVDVNSLRYVSVGQPIVRVQALASGQLDATAASIGNWVTMPDRSGMRQLVDQETFYKLAPFVSKLDVVTEEVAKTKSREIEAVVRAIMTASRDFAKDPSLWVKAMTAARPDVSPDDLAQLAQAYRDKWSVNGGLDLQAVAFTTDTAYRTADFEGLRPVPPAEWIDTRFIDKVIGDLGVDPQSDSIGR